jgi:hypothetical protein
MFAKDLYEIITDQRQIINGCEEKGLIKETPACDVYGCLMKF